MFLGFQTNCKKSFTENTGLFLLFCSVCLQGECVCLQGECVCHTAAPSGHTGQLGHQPINSLDVKAGAPVGMHLETNDKTY